MIVRERLNLENEVIPTTIPTKIGKIRNGRIVHTKGPKPRFVASYHNYTSIFVMIRDDPSKNQ